MGLDFLENGENQLHKDGSYCNVQAVELDTIDYDTIVMYVVGTAISLHKWHSLTGPLVPFFKKNSVARRDSNTQRIFHTLL